MSEPRVSDEQLADMIGLGRPTAYPRKGVHLEDKALAVIQMLLDEHYDVLLDLRDARAELAAMRPVVEAAVAYRDDALDEPSVQFDRWAALCGAVDAYRGRKP